MEISIKHIGKTSNYSTIIQIDVNSNGNTITEDITNLKGFVDENFIQELRNIADQLEEQNKKVLESLKVDYEEVNEEEIDLNQLDLFE